MPNLLLICGFGLAAVGGVPVCWTGPNADLLGYGYNPQCHAELAVQRWARFITKTAVALNGLNHVVAERHRLARRIVQPATVTSVIAPSDDDRRASKQTVHLR